MPAVAKPARANAEPALPTRELILDAAERLFATRGVDSVAVRDLARELGITASSLYNHFPGKQALYEAVLERGVRPLVELVAAAVREPALRPDYVHVTAAGLTQHLAAHPNLAALLQRALLEESELVRKLVGQWFLPLYRDGIGIIRQVAGATGWTDEEVPHLAVALFGMVFAYFTNAEALRRMGGWPSDPFGPAATERQSAVLEKAVLRLLGRRSRARAPRRRSRS